MVKGLKISVLYVLVLLLISCGSMYKTVKIEKLKYEGSSASKQPVVLSGLKVILADFYDERKIQPSICNTFDTAGEVDDTWNSSIDVNDFIKEGIIYELSLIGVDAVKYNYSLKDMDIPELSGRLRIFYGWYDKKSNFVSAVNIDFIVTHKPYTIFYKSYLGESKTGSCGISLTESTRKALKEAAKDIKEALIKEAPYVKK